MTGTNDSSNSTHPIHQYISLLSGKRPNPSYINTIILKCLSDPNIYTGFSELRALPCLQAMDTDNTNNADNDTSSSTPTPTPTPTSNSQSQSLLRTLDLFSHGNYLDYKNAKDGFYIQLNDVQKMKLKLLTVLSVVQQAFHRDNKDNDGGSKATNATASTSGTRTRRNRRNQISSIQKPKPKPNQNCNIVQYSILHSALDMDTTQENDNSNNSRSLEDILIQCIYCKLLPNGSKLDQKNQCLLVQYDTTNHNIQESSQSVLCRDVNLNGSSNVKDNNNSNGDSKSDLDDMIDKLNTMYQRGENVKNKLINSLNELNKGLVDDGKRWKKVEQDIQITKNKVLEKNRLGGGNNSGGGNSGSGGGDAMMVDMEGSGHDMSQWTGMGGGSSMAAKRQLKRSRGGRSGKA
jgi:hypothetical protein